MRLELKSLRVQASFDTAPARSTSRVHKHRIKKAAVKDKAAIKENAILQAEHSAVTSELTRVKEQHEELEAVCEAVCDHYDELFEQCARLTEECVAGGADWL